MNTLSKVGNLRIQATIWDTPKTKAWGSSSKGKTISKNVEEKGF
ncbi:MAG: hypothetical protein ABJB11_11475 [Ferruginibacter sp.]